MQMDWMTLERKLVTIMSTAGDEDCGGPQKECDAVAKFNRVYLQKVSSTGHVWKDAVI